MLSANLPIIVAIAIITVLSVTLIIINGEGKNLGATSKTPNFLPVNLPTPTLSNPQISNQNEIIFLLQYPGSNLIETEMGLDGKEQTVTFESNEDSNILTNWYKENFAKLGMKNSSSIVTSTDENILNKLMAKNENIEIEVTVTRRSNQQLSKIILSIYNK